MFHRARFVIWYQDIGEVHKSPGLHLRACALILGIVARIHLQQRSPLMDALKVVIEVIGTLCLTVRQADPPVLEVTQAAVVGLTD